MATFTRQFPRVTDQSISRCESKLGVTLPADYRRFLKTINGGIPEPNCFHVPERNFAIVGILYGIKDERSSCDLEYEQEQAAMWDPLPDGFVAIGEDPGGCLLLLNTIGKDAGQILFWDRKGFWVKEDGRNTFPVASNFTAFLESLRV